MTIYVDDAYIKAKVGRLDTRWCHMTSDTSKEELIEFAESIGLRAEWFQKGSGMPGSPASRFWHFDVTPGVRVRAIRAGAQECTTRQQLKIMLERP